MPWIPIVPGELSDLSDVDTSGATGGDALVYDDGPGIWVPGEVSGGGGGGSYSETIGDNTNTDYQVVHNLDTTDLVVQLWDLTGADPVEATADADSITIDDNDTITVAFSVAPSADAYRVVVLSDGGTGSGGGGGGTFLESTKSVTDSIDDEFDDSTNMSGENNGVDNKWTVVSGSAGTVNLLETSNVARYDLNTLPGSLLMQAGRSGSQRVELRQDFTLGDGEGVVCALSPSLSGELGNNEIWVGMSLNNNDAGFNSGDYVSVHVENDGTPTIYTYTGSNLFSQAAGGLTTIFFRVERSGSTYYTFYSTDGRSWLPMANLTPGSAFNNLWIYAWCDAAFSEAVPIQVFHWIRLVESQSLDPWTWRSS